VDLTNDIRDSCSSNVEDLIFLRHGSVTHWQDITSERNWIFALIGLSLVSCCLPSHKNWRKFVVSHRCCPNYTVRYRVCSNVLEVVWVKNSQWTVYKTRRPMSKEKWPWQEPTVLSAFLLATHPTVRTCNFAEPACCLVTSS
jgi:hypothetical protein